jgi:antitoxin VapB
MAFSIRNPRAEKLARQFAAESGESLTEAIIHALEERLERLKRRRTTTDFAKEIMKISLRCRALPGKNQRTARELDLLLHHARIEIVLFPPNSLRLHGLPGESTERDDTRRG